MAIYYIGIIFLVGVSSSSAFPINILSLFKILIIIKIPILGSYTSTHPFIYQINDRDVSSLCFPLPLLSFIYLIILKEYTQKYYYYYAIFSAWIYNKYFDATTKYSVLRVYACLKIWMGIYFIARLHEKLYAMCRQNQEDQFK